MNDFYTFDSPFECIRNKALELDYKRRKKKLIFNKIRNISSKVLKSLINVAQVIIIAWAIYFVSAFIISCVFPADAWIQRLNFFWYYAKQ